MLVENYRTQSLVRNPNSLLEICRVESLEAEDRWENPKWCSFLGRGEGEGEMEKGKGKQIDLLGLILVSVHIPRSRQ